MSYQYYIHNKWYETSYEDNVKWLNSQYEKYGDRIVFADISPYEDEGFSSSVIVKNQQELESQPEQNKIQL